MNRMGIKILALLIALCGWRASALGTEIDWERYAEKSGISVETVMKIMRIECRGGVNSKGDTSRIEEFAELLVSIRNDGWLPPYSVGWCLKNGIVPPNLKGEN